MASFGGYDMPLWYASAKAEHLAVLSSAGLFDTSHMAAVLVEGPDAHGLLQWCFTRDLDAATGAAPLADGRCAYGAFLNESGGVIDDAIVYRMGPETFLTVVNAGMGVPVTTHLEAHAGGRSVRLTDFTDGLGKMDLQGPLAARILEPLLSDPDAALDGLVYFGFRGGLPGVGISLGSVALIDGTPILLSRTGYTGEFGFEIFTPPDRFTAVWEMILEAGRPLGIGACGLAARDSLRAGAVLPLSHQDIGPWPFLRHPWPFALPLDPATESIRFTKEFLGAAALLRASDPPYTLAYAGYDVRKVSPPADVLDDTGVVIGRVLTCATDVSIGRGRDDVIVGFDGAASPPKGLCCGFVLVSRPLSPGASITLRDARRQIPARVETDIRPNRSARRAMSRMRQWPAVS